MLILRISADFLAGFRGLRGFCEFYILLHSAAFLRTLVGFVGFGWPWLVRAARGFGVTSVVLRAPRPSLLDDWLRRERFVYVGWSGLLLLPNGLSISSGGWFIGITFATSQYTHVLASSFLEGCNVLTAAVSTPQQRIWALPPSPLGTRGCG